MVSSTQTLQGGERTIMPENYNKVYVKVEAVFDEAGQIMPTAIHWEDGLVYYISKVTDIRQAAALKVGGQGDRYTVSVRGQKSFLFFERNTNQTGNNIGRWFVERKRAI